VLELSTITGDLEVAVSGSDYSGEDVASRPILVGDPDDWQSRWGALAALRDRADILFDSCTVSDYRALSRSRELPPLIAGRPNSHRALCWHVTRDGTAVRVELPLD
jgi:S-DNA-T family DNA segregation ATPase FtsK/SpoIIIE